LTKCNTQGKVLAKKRGLLGTMMIILVCLLRVILCESLKLVQATPSIILDGKKHDFHLDKEETGRKARLPSRLMVIPDHVVDFKPNRIVLCGTACVETIEPKVTLTYFRSSLGESRLHSCQSFIYQLKKNIAT
jgi:hypothetical protein